MVSVCFNLTTFNSFREHITASIDVTMFQRGSTYVLSGKEGIPRLMGGTYICCCSSPLSLIKYFPPYHIGLYWEGGPPTDDADLISASFPINFMRVMNPRLTAEIAAADKYDQSMAFIAYILDLRLINIQEAFGRPSQKRLPHELGSGRLRVLATDMGARWWIPPRSVISNDSEMEKSHYLILNLQMSAVASSLQMAKSSSKTTHRSHIFPLPVWFSITEASFPQMS